MRAVISVFHMPTRPSFRRPPQKPPAAATGTTCTCPPPLRPHALSTTRPSLRPPLTRCLQPASLRTRGSTTRHPARRPAPPRSGVFVDPPLCIHAHLHPHPTPPRTPPTKRAKGRHRTRCRPRPTASAARARPHPNSFPRKGGQGGEKAPTRTAAGVLHVHKGEVRATRTRGVHADTSGVRAGRARTTRNQIPSPSPHPPAGRAPSRLEAHTPLFDRRRRRRDLSSKDAPRSLCRECRCHVEPLVGRERHPRGRWTPRAPPPYTSARKLQERGIRPETRRKAAAEICWCWRIRMNKQRGEGGHRFCKEEREDRPPCKVEARRIRVGTVG